MHELFEQFITERKYVTGVSAATIQWYRSSWKCFSPFLGGDNIKQGLIAGIQALSASNSAISINTYLRCIRAFLRWAHSEGHLCEPVSVPKLKEEQKTLSSFTPEHVRRFIQWAPPKPTDRRLQTLVLLLLDCGVRIQEALSLRRESVDLDNLLVTVLGKGRKMRTVPISFEMRRRLYRHLKTHPYPLVFCSRDGGPLGQRNVLRDMKLAAKALGIQGVRVSPHTCRHCFALNYIRSGGDVFRLQRILGHASLEMTRRYVNLQTADLQACHERFSVLATAR